MKYLKLTFKYTNSKFIYFFLIVLVPAVLMSFLIAPSASIDFVCRYFSHDRSSFRAIYLFLTGTNVKYIYLGVIGLAAMALSVSVLFGAVYRHMLTGEFDISPKRIFTRLNYNYLTAVKLLFLAGAIFELFTLLNAATFYLWAVLFVPKVALAFSVISLAGFYVLALLCFSIIILWAPNMLHTGYSTGRALSEAVQIIRGNNFKIASALGLASLLPLFFMVIFSVFELKIMGLSLLRVVDSFCYLFLVIYYIILMYTAFFDLTGTDRADFGRKFKWS
ncbi:MAG: hypothetical protein ACOYIN_05105 [Christensenellales bacterium]|jgi:hypothetical protein|nr:hypothetical protein [Clostridia bacterium]HRU83964.1 hypothetical protein [Eubacteriales bacterium]